MTRFIVKLAAGLSFLAMVLAGVMILYGLQLYQGDGPLRTEKFHVIERGQPVAQIARDLERADIIEQALVFRIAARLTERDKAIHAGEYRFAAGVSMAEVLEKLASGDVHLRRFTIPEGLTSWQVVQILSTFEGLSGTIEDVPAEGSLLPETYSYIQGTPRREKITQMQEAMDQVLGRLWETRQADLPLAGPEEALVLASIVEKETGVSGERDMVAGVFINRLRRGMKLQSDPTVIYAITGGKVAQDGQGPLGRRLLRSDWEYDSPYNTYKYAGLPPQPIANPGRASIAAVLNPQEHDYLYFVADGTGGHVFAKTLAEHNRNAARWRIIRKQQEEP